MSDYSRFRRTFSLSAETKNSDFRRLCIFTFNTKKRIYKPILSIANWKKRKQLIQAEVSRVPGIHQKILKVHMTRKILKIALVVFVLLIIIFIIKLIKGTDQGNPIPNKKGSPLEQRP